MPAPTSDPRDLPRRPGPADFDYPPPQNGPPAEPPALSDPPALPDPPAVSADREGDFGQALRDGAVARPGSPALRRALDQYDQVRETEAARRYAEEGEFMHHALDDILRRARGFVGEEPINDPSLSEQVTVWRHEVLQSSVYADLQYPGLSLRATKYRLYDTCYGRREGVRLGLLSFDCPDCGRTIEGHDLPLLCIAGLGHVVNRGCVDAPDFLGQKSRAAAKVAKARTKGKQKKVQRVIDRLRVKEIRQHARGCPKRRRYWKDDSPGGALSSVRRRAKGS
jgi:hypothetical protein